jgi:hypothetical protein
MRGIGRRFRKNEWTRGRGGEWEKGTPVIEVKMERWREGDEREKRWGGFFV